jgi:hypothetical protein
MELLMPAHIVFMSIALILVITAAVIAKRRKPMWLKLHKRCAFSGALSSVIGAVCMVVLKIAHGYSHFQSPHAVVGLVTLCLLIITPVLGASIVKGPKPLRALHKVMGRITSVAIILTVCSGVFRFLQIKKSAG